MATSETQPGNPGALAEGNFLGISAFSQTVRDVLAAAAEQEWSEMVWADSNFEDWPLREKSVVDALQAWAGRGRKLVLLAQRFDSIQKYQPRFVSWRVTWDHIVECRVCKQGETSDFPSALWSPAWAVRRLDLVRSTGWSTGDAQRKLLLRENLEELRRQSSPGFPASVLGL